MRMIDKIYAKRDEIYAVARALMAEKLWVSGSCARKGETSESDIDFRVKFGEGGSTSSPCSHDKFAERFFRPKS